MTPRIRSVLAAVAILVTGPAALSAGTDAWTRIGPEGGSVPRLLVDPRSPGTLYALAGGAVFKSINGARTWSLAISGLESANVSLLAINPQTPSTLYAVTGSGGFKTTDGAKSWRRLNSVPANANALVVDPRSGALYVRTCAGLAVSTDGGEGWRENGFPPPAACTSMLAIDPSTGALFTTRAVFRSEPWPWTHRPRARSMREPITESSAALTAAPVGLP